MDEESIDLLVRKFGKFLKKKRAQKSKGFSRNEDSIKSGKDKVKCHECGKTGHIRPTCPIYLKRVEGEKKYKKNFKSKRAYIVWDTPPEDNEASTSSSEDEESANLCLMTNHDEGESSSSESSEQNSKNEVYDSDSNSENNPSYDELYNAFNELHDELKKVAKISIARKRLILQHEKKALELKKLVAELKLQNETLELIYANASCDCASKVNVVLECETCETLKIENENLKKSLTNFTKGTNNLSMLLGYQRNVELKSGLGFKHKSYRKLVEHNHEHDNTKPTCFYCGLHGHTTNTCHIKKFGVPKGKYVWIEKGQDPYANPKGPKTIWVPKSSN